MPLHCDLDYAFDSHLTTRGNWIITIEHVPTESVGRVVIDQGTYNRFADWYFHWLISTHLQIGCA